MVSINSNSLVSALLLNYLFKCLHQPSLQSPRETWLIYDPQFKMSTEVVSSLLMTGQAARVFTIDRLSTCPTAVHPYVAPNFVTLMVTSERLSSLELWFNRCVVAVELDQKHILVVEEGLPIIPLVEIKWNIPTETVWFNPNSGDWKALQWKNRSSCTDLSGTLPPLMPNRKPLQFVSVEFMVPGYSRILRIADDNTKFIAVGSGVSAIRLIAEALGWTVYFKANENPVLTLKHPGKALLPGQLTTMKYSNNLISTHIITTKPYVYPFFIIDLAVIVPFDVIEDSNTVATVFSNASIVLVWVMAALLLTTVRFCIAWLPQFQLQRKRSFAYMYFDTLAKALGSTCGECHDDRPANYLAFSVSCFSILASALCAGAFYDQQFAGEPQQRLDTVEDLFASEMNICVVESFMPSFEMVPPGVWIRTVQLKTMLRWLKRGDCKCAYLVPVFLLHTLHVKPYQSDDQTPVFHIMREQIKNVGAGFRINQRHQAEWTDAIHSVALALQESGIFAHKDRIISHLFHLIDPDLGKFNAAQADRKTADNPDVGHLLMWVMFAGGLTASLMCFGVELMAKKFSFTF